MIGRALISLGLALGIVGLAYGFTAPGYVSPPDPFVLQQPLCTPPPLGYCDQGYIGGVLPVVQGGYPLNPAARNLVIMTVGDVNSANYLGNGISGDTDYVVTHPGHVFSISVYDGGVYELDQCPVYGAYWNPAAAGTSLDGNHYGAWLADDLIAAGIADNVYLVAIAEAGFQGVPGYLASDWYTGILSDRISIAYKRLLAKGIPLHGILWGEGEYDAQTGVSQAAYQAALLGVITNSRAAGITAPWFVAIETWQNGAADPAIQAAQAAVVNNTTVFAGPNADAIGNRDSFSGTIFNNAGASQLATAWQSALHAYGPPF